MDIQSKITDAIADLAAELVGGASASIVAEIASDYDLKVEVLTARFERQHGVAPAAYAAHVIAKSAEQARGRAVIAAAEVKKAERDAAESAAIKEWFASNPTFWAGTSIRRQVERAEVITLL